MSRVFAVFLCLFAAANTFSIVCSHSSSVECLSEAVLQEDENADALALLQKSAQSVTKQGKMNSEQRATSNASSNTIADDSGANVLNNSQLNLANSSVDATTFMADLESMIELELKPVTVPTKNKVILAIIEMLFLGFCGIDRCYMGQTCIGIIKGITLGGLGIWTMLDYFTIVVWCLAEWKAVDFFGYNAMFETGTIMPAFWITTVCLVLLVCCGSGGTLLKWRRARNAGWKN